MGLAAGRQKPPPPSKAEVYEIQMFVHTMLSKVLRDLPFNRNQPLISADNSALEICEIK
jgi:hypothetical protein